MYNNELYHYGVKGMKWGHRKKSTSTGDTVKKIEKTVGKAGHTVYKGLKKVDDRLEAKGNKRFEKAKKYIDQRESSITTAMQTGRAIDAYQSQRKLRTGLRSITAGVLNAAANYYISSSDVSYRAKIGIDYARRAGIMALSVSDIVDRVATNRVNSKIMDYGAMKTSERGKNEINAVKTAAKNMKKTIKKRVQNW